MHPYSVEFPDLLKIALHTGPDCDPDTRSLVPGYAELRDQVTPWIPHFLPGVKVRRCKLDPKA